MKIFTLVFLLGVKEIYSLKYAGVRLIKDLRNEMLQTDSIKWDESVTAYMND